MNNSKALALCHAVAGDVTDKILNEAAARRNSGKSGKSSSSSSTSSTGGKTSQSKKDYNQKYYQEHKSYWAKYYEENYKNQRRQQQRQQRNADRDTYEEGGIRRKVQSRAPGEIQFDMAAQNKIRKRQEEIGVTGKDWTKYGKEARAIWDEAEKQKKKYRQSYIDQQYKKAAEKARMRQHFKTPVASVPVSSTLSPPAKLVYNTKQFLSKTVSSISSGLANLGEQLMKALKI